MQAKELESIIRSKLPDLTALIVSDVSGGCGQAFDVVLVSPSFQGLPTLKRHRMINDLLKTEIAQLHAFSQKTYTPAQYEALSGGPPSASTTAAEATALNTTGFPASSPNTPTAAAPPASSSSLTPATPPPKTRSSSNSAHHQRSTSNVSIPELTLTTDDDTLAGQAAHSGSNPRPLTPSSQPGGSTSHFGSSSDILMHETPTSPANNGPGISRLHHSKVTSPEFWEGLRGYLESQLITIGGAAGSPGIGQMDNPLASPSAGGGGGGSVKGEAELTRLWEDFFQSQKPHLSASDVARVRDGTGMFGM